MRLSQKQLKELSAKGQRMMTEDGKRYFPRREKPAATEKIVTVETVTPPPKEDAFQKEAISAIIAIAQANESNMTAIAGNQSAIAGAIAEMMKPKPQKQWHCSIIRDTRGTMVSVDIGEK
jgi:hypothetical protein